MAKSKPTGLDAPVSNQPQEIAEAAAKAQSKPPSDGADHKSTPPKADGSETVPGHKPTLKPASELYTAPTTALHDIGEASFGPPPPLKETVHGPDDRVQINNTSVYPW